MAKTKPGAVKPQRADHNMVPTDIDAVHWRVLRCLLRNGGPMIGQDLRLSPGRRFKSGHHLSAMVSNGLIRVVTPGADAILTTYELTEPGEYAAEYGGTYFDWTAKSAMLPPAEWRKSVPFVRQEN